jgi:hypothetical protein
MGLTCIQKLNQKRETVVYLYAPPNPKSSSCQPEARERELFGRRKSMVEIGMDGNEEGRKVFIVVFLIFFFFLY